MATTEELNGIKLPELNQALERMSATAKDPAGKLILNTRYARIFWIKGFEVKAASGGGTFRVDESIDRSPEARTPSSVEYLLAIVGACVAIGFVYNATRRQIQIQHLEIALEGEMDNILTFMRISDDGHAGYRRMDLRVYVRADAAQTVLQDVLDETVRTSPVVNTLQCNVQLNPQLRVIE